MFLVVALACCLEVAKEIVVGVISFVGVEELPGVTWSVAQGFGITCHEAGEHLYVHSDLRKCLKDGRHLAGLSSHTFGNRLGRCRAHEGLASFKEQGHALGIEVRYEAM